MSPGPRASVLIRTRDGGERLRRVVAQVEAQREVEFEVVLLDSGSTDGVSAALAGGRVRWVGLEGPFTHPRSSNAAARAARGELLVFLSQDAVPLADRWLARLLAPLEEPAVAAAFSRQVPDARTPALEARDLERAYPPRGASPTVLSNAASVLRRALWAEHPFDESLPLAEDLEWGLWAQARGLRVAYVPESVVEHPHRFDESRLDERYRAEGRALAQLGRNPFGAGPPAGAWLRGLPGDLAAVLRAGRWRELGTPWSYHLRMYRALRAGYEDVARASAAAPETAGERR
ncbi:MAG TPA: glycosyltransferase [Candidatus Saccharimonadales bacterium]|nr:glycosyltransferase [Candidatus Saccharimonadales bacterium]